MSKGLKRRYFRYGLLTRVVAYNNIGTHSKIIPQNARIKRVDQEVGFLMSAPVSSRFVQIIGLSITPAKFVTLLNVKWQRDLTLDTILEQFLPTTLVQDNLRRMAPS